MTLKTWRFDHVRGAWYYAPQVDLAIRVLERDHDSIKTRLEIRIQELTTQLAEALDKPRTLE
jgi:hypothetical protein